MKIKKGEIYYFYLGKNFVEWGKVYNQTDEYVMVVASHSLHDIENIPVGSVSDFLTQKVVYMNCGTKLCNIEDLETHINPVKGYSSIWEEIENEWNGEIDSYLKYGHGMVIVDGELKKFKNMNSHGVDCKYTTHTYRRDRIRLFIPYKDAIEIDEIVSYGVCKPPTKKIFRKLTIDKLVG